MTAPVVNADRGERWYCFTHKTLAVDICAYTFLTPCDLRVLVPVGQREAETWVIEAAAALLASVEPVPSFVKSREVPQERVFDLRRALAAVQGGSDTPHTSGVCEPCETADTTPQEASE